ncbi:MAG: OadG family protein [Clostridia bacterium]|nr:OadG family protein [Clostridia bacterium]
MTFLTSTLPDHLVNMEIGSAAVIALLGYAVVFFGIVLLMCVMIVMGKIFVAKANKEKAKEAAPKAAAPVAAPAAPAAPAVAPGTAGQLKLHDVPPKTAAMIMAIVADTMGKPLNELRFISIKEVK